MTDQPDLDTWTKDAAAWLDEQLPKRTPAADVEWGDGSDSMALFKNFTHEQEAAHVDALRDWQRRKSDAGYGSITWPEEFGGAGLPLAFDAAFDQLERDYEIPGSHESVGITLDLIGPTILHYGSDEQKARYLRPLRRTDEMWCQLFSEPGAGSDLGAVGTKAVRDGDEWVITGQKVWTSGAQFADFGYLLARDDPTKTRPEGFTSFLVPMRAPGVEVRPLRQMSGGSPFNEVFFDELRVPDSCRLGDVGIGWKVMITTLGFERMAASRSSGGGTDAYEMLRLLARHLGRDRDPVVRQALAEIYSGRRIHGWTMKRASTNAKALGVPGPEGSFGKLAVTRGLHKATALASLLLGPRLTADTGEWGTFAWTEYVNGVPGFRIAGGTDEVQHNIVGERVLGLPREPR
jgi:alkylation response protein AidB-like acyl-CoA dehydrogenase